MPALRTVAWSLKANIDCKTFSQFSHGINIFIGSIMILMLAKSDKLKAFPHDILDNI